MELGLAGKTAIVTAGAHGIGEATADELTREGVKVVVLDVDAAALSEKGARWHGTVISDLASPEGVAAAIDGARSIVGGAPDILVNNAGVADQLPFADLNDAVWQRSHELNLMAAVRFCRAFMPSMRSRAGSAVVNVSSDLAKQPEPMPMEYGVAKAGLLYLTKGLAKEYAPEIRVNCVCPGPVWTRLWYRDGGILDQLAAQYGVGRDEALEKYLSDRYMPLGMGKAEDVAKAIVFLASNAAAGITGAAIDLCGTNRGLI